MLLSRLAPALLSVMCLTVSAPASAVSQNDPVIGQASVIDGDTLDITGQRVRLHGIDAPESSQSCRDAQGNTWRCGQQAALALADYIGRAHVRCRPQTTDRYGRLVAVCHLGEVDLGGWMVRSGWALAYRKYAQDYVPQEQQAQSARRGIWQGRFVPPDQWRNGQRLDQPAKTGNRPDCRIKGNISQSGQRIYHLPGMAWYDRTRIDTRAGERWFCTEAEARAAGWRKAR